MKELETPWVNDKDKPDAETIVDSGGWGKGDKSDADDILKSGW